MHTTLQWQLFTLGIKCQKNPAQEYFKLLLDWHIFIWYVTLWPSHWETHWQKCCQTVRSKWACALPGIVPDVKWHYIVHLKCSFCTWTTIFIFLLPCIVFLCSPKSWVARKWLPFQVRECYEQFFAEWMTLIPLDNCSTLGFLLL